VRLGGSPVLHLARVVIVSLLSLSSFAQPASQKVSLEIGGATVWLGMPRQEVIDRCASAGLKQMTADRNSILFRSGDDLYSVQFKNDRLVFADRDWLPSKSGLDAFQTTLAALASISDSDKDSVSACTISHQPLNNPDNQANRVFVSCGKRSFLLMEHRIKGESYYDVMERIGEAFTTE
jgi:hypothetical protein